ncbi:MAG: DUF4276 family protein [Nitrospirae bacterium]|nr:DUF4276 family protein [Nitrospirota bacterium]
MIYIDIVFEDPLSGAVISKLLSCYDKFSIRYSYNIGGFVKIKKNIKGYNNASKHTPYFVLTDLDKKKCAPELISEWITFQKHPNLLFRVAVREVESWLLADREGFSDFAKVNLMEIPVKPDEIADPKLKLLEIIKKSKDRALKDDILSRYYGKIGPNYNGKLSEFVNDSWDIERAVENSPSLNRTHKRLVEFQYISNES